MIRRRKLGGAANGVYKSLLLESLQKPTMRPPNFSGNRQARQSRLPVELLIWVSSSVHSSIDHQSSIIRQRLSHSGNNLNSIQLNWIQLKKKWFGRNEILPVVPVKHLYRKQSMKHLSVYWQQEGLKHFENWRTCEERTMLKLPIL